ncbi:hypothetical protein QR680_004004 [Steinernema hermaphroditum]|uniref:Uncharacterized protein n=1 Tax=Steinernema hermaphroditum TaxID=289476 RepID=A0AA39HPM1_9BILA|nr:hypothetical protein QR680_004004 [Steinernema hermaphroditum]
MFLKVYDDSRDCSDTDSVFSTPPYDTFQTTYSAKSQNSKLIACPLVILSPPSSLSPLLQVGSALHLGINSIQGTDKSVKVLPGTNNNATPFYEVSNRNLNLWVDTTLNFSISTTYISYDASIDYYGHKMGIFMTPNYPNGDASKQDSTSRSLKLTNYGNDDYTFKAKFEVFGSLSPSSSLFVLADSKVVLNATSGTKLQSSYDTGYANTVSFVYGGPEGEKGFFIRYEVIPKGASILSLSVVVGLIVTLCNLIM